MDKMLNEFMEGKNLTVEGNMVYGSYRSYQMATITNAFNVNFCGTQIFTKLNVEERELVKTYLTENKAELKLLNFEVNDYGFYFKVKTITKKSGYENLKQALDKVIDFISSKEIKNENYCPITGEELTEDKKLLTIYGFKAYVGADSASEMERLEAAAEEEYQNSPNNYLQGILGALGLGAIGAVVWIVVGVFLNIVSGWIAALIAFLAGFGYEKMKGKPNNVKIIVSAGVTLFYIVLSMFLIYVFIVLREMNNYGLEGNPISLLFDLFELNPDAKTEFFQDLALGLVFGIIGIVISSINMRNTLHKRSKNI